MGDEALLQLHGEGSTSFRAGLTRALRRQPVTQGPGIRQEALTNEASRVHVRSAGTGGLA